MICWTGTPHNDISKQLPCIIFSTQPNEVQGLLYHIKTRPEHDVKLHPFIVTGSILYWCVMRPASQLYTVVFVYESWSYLIQQRFFALVAFLCRCAVKLSINQSTTSKHSCNIVLLNPHLFKSRLGWRQEGNMAIKHSLHKLPILGGTVQPWKHGR